MLRRKVGTSERTFLPEIFAMSAAVLLLEISYTRIISFKLYYYYTYFTIGLALLGLGSGAVFVAVSARIKRTPTGVLLRRCAIAAVVAVAVGYVLVARMPLDTIALWEANRSRQLVSVTQLMGICLGLFITFLPVGIAVAALFARRSEMINRLYFADLAGAALACLVVVPMMAWVGPVSAVAVVAVVLLVVAIRLLEPDSRAAIVALGVLAVVFAVVAVRPTIAPDIRTEETKQLRPDLHVAESRWSALFRVDAVQFPRNVVLFHDGIWGSGIWPWDGRRESLAHFDTDDRSIPFAALGSPPERMLIIGAAGGHEIQAALYFGAGQIDAVELNPATASLLRGPYADYSGNITTRPGVNYVVGDGRTFLAGSDNHYDLVWFVAPDSYSASNAASSGAFVLSESYLYTREMLRDALDHLTPNGMVVMQFGERNYDRTPNRTARLASTARSAYAAEGIDSFPDDIAVITSNQAADLSLSTTLMKRTAFSADELDRIAGKQDDIPGTAVRYLPGRPADDPSAPVNTVITDGPGSLRGYPHDVGAITDDRPFFWHFTPYASVAGDLLNPVSDIDVEVGIGERVMLLLLAIAIVLAALFLLAPFVWVRDTWRVLPDKAITAPIFGILGLAFIAFEITMIQRFSLFLGYPTYSLTVTLMALLLFTGIGAFVSPRWHANTRRLLRVLGTTIVILGVFYALATPSLMDALQAWPTIIKAFVVVCLCAPLGFCLGMFMPLAITLVAARTEHRTEYVAWGWAINGFFSVIGSILTTIVSMAYGFRAVLFSAVGLYLVAVVLLGVLSRRQPVDPMPAAGPPEVVEVVASAN
jgi:spermidine synthase